MFELHITPKPKYTNKFVDVCKRLNFKIITHTNYDINGNSLYSETMIAEKCKNLSELNQKIDLLFDNIKQNDICRVKIETIITDNDNNGEYSYSIPYKLGSQYYELHVDVLLEEDSKEEILKLINICRKCNCMISKNPHKESYMLTHRIDNNNNDNKNIQIFKNNCELILKECTKNNLYIIRQLKEYCFCDDNIEVDNPWVKTYN